MQRVFTMICLAVVSSMNIGTVEPMLYLGAEVKLYVCFSYLLTSLSEICTVPCK